MLTVTDKTTHEQMIERAKTQLEVNATERVHLQTRLASIETELSTLFSREQSRHQLVSTSKTTVSSARAKSSELEAQCLMSEGTSVHEALLKEQKDQSKTLARVEKDLAALQARTSEASSVDASRREALLSEQAQARDRLAGLTAQDSALQAAMKTAFSAIGELEYAEVRSQVDAMNALIVEAEQRLQADRQALASAIQVGEQRLERWPGLRNQVHLLQQFSNPMTEVLTSELTYLNNLLEHTRALMQDDMSSYSALNGLYNWLQVFTISDAEIWVQENLFGQPRLLRDRRDRVALLLEQYTAAHR